MTATASEQLPQTPSDYLEEIGLVSTNVERLNHAMSELHDAICRMDLAQLRTFKRTAMGEAAIKLASEYGLHSHYLRKDF